MSNLAIELEQTLRELDPSSALALERLVRDALALAQPSKAHGLARSGTEAWPEDYFQKTAGSFAVERLDVPGDPPPEPMPQ